MGTRTISFNIGVACISPGFLNTMSTNRALAKVQVEHLKKATPMKRLGSTKELNHAINFVIKNDFFNGKGLSLDSGLEI